MNKIFDQINREDFRYYNYNETFYNAIVNYLQTKHHN